MKRLTVLSGKGGTGKTSMSAAFGYLSRSRAVLCDCDVDASNLALAVGASNIQSGEFSGGSTAVINADLCTGCGKCFEVCRFDAIKKLGGKFKVESMACEGCAYCAWVCPADAITMVERKSGDIFSAQSRFGSAVVYAELTTGAENSGKLSTQVRRMADDIAEKNGAEIIIIDGPPGVSCPAIAAATGVDYILFVAEPTLSGISDLRRGIEMAQKLAIPAGIIVNRSDINEEMTTHIKELAEKAGIDFWGTIPFSHDFVSAIRKGRTIMEETTDSRITSVLEQTWQSLLTRIESKK